MFRNLLRSDSALMQLLSRITDCIFFSLFWLVGCLGIVTVAASGAALYDAAYRGIRQGDKHSWQRFYQAFRANLKPGILPSLILLAAVGLLGWGGIALWNNAVWGNISWLLFAAGAMVAVVVLGTVSLMIPILSRFDNSLPQLLKNTLLLALGNMPATVAVGMMYALGILVCARFVFPVFLLPGLLALIQSFPTEKLLRPFMPEEE